MNTKCFCLCFFVGFAVFVVGCGTKYPSTNLTGKVSVDGETLTEGSITFAPMESGFGSGVRVFLNSDGTYTAKAVPTGKVRVTILSDKKTGRKTKGMAGEEVDEVTSAIPASKSGGIFIDITSGQTVCDFDLESDKESFRGPGS